MSPVHKLSQMGSLTTTKTDYPTMLANYGDFGALQRIGFQTISGSSTSSISFNNIPQNFQDLIVVGNFRNDSASGQGLNIYPNNTSTNSNTSLRGDGSTASSNRNSSIAIQNYMFTTTLGTGVFESTIIHILNYANTSTFKTFLSRRAADNNGSGVTELGVGTARITASITSLVIAAPSGNYTAGSTFSLYGVKASAA